ncbi:MAG TPA: ABC transporter ATP-binding protein [Euzebyales bacterium]|nr:ABC transporter ATP-binding protein [Euzebyales bacterium]
MLLRTRDLTHRFGPHVAVDGVTLTVGAGEVVGLLGANGAGKTTLVRLILGLVRPWGGRVELFGAPPSRRARSRIGYLPQGLGLYEDLTVVQHLDFTARAYGYRRVATDIPGDTGRPIAELPLGARRLAAFAAATGHHPDLLLLDEPTSGVDPLGRARLWDRIRDHADAGRGVLVSTHHMSEAEQCDRVVVMGAGRVVADGRVDDVIAGQRTVAVTTDTWQPAFAVLDAAGLPVALAGRRLRVIGTPARAVASALAAADVAAEITEVPATFEEVFVELTRRRAA